jgi:thiopurine S-methyltransferase
MKELTSDFWKEKYETNETGWDIGHISTPLKEYIDQLENKDLKILIPGCGNAYEAEYIFKKGFKNVFVIDFSPIALKNFKDRTPDFPEEQLICDDFFNHKGKYDLIIEQTFFCAITPNLRSKYAKKMFELLNENGKLVGLLFDDKLNDDKPPFGGNKEEYLDYFKPYFIINKMESAYNSISPRMTKELFINLSKK